ncbi:regulator of sigma E protease [Breznakia sp. PF5-3]|uniref:RIP metalloprotease RseP n=1 Tax=unclassified Breznakia TaxID=2623764 RepID=UPI0024052689|nr:MULTISPECIES: RIP metalloprotease RseP [unclassified Breznakia]MDL2276149.1 RIP metalloprotease RseP [Breznakia sp. OttesenSCG-928-G09]MDF9824403.1 regulator of sigma E protease [Breznakia sp. PM6-1]MDF9835132.1 regulator of sigma E protease [Breznakia sp. PF5-3]MDF9838219.1 regulator of sigma E protease [Breznakia sp. PFB2-8]MDF9860234.1 regulator of sigma E protease [Breznakia sp. PH5-24]
MNIILQILSFVILLGIIVLIHELGHFITAKRFGVYCGEFSIGMGPVLFKKQIGETQYSLRLLPIGGFVSMAGEEDDTKKDENIPFERTINGIKTYKKVIVMLAGIIMNIILAWVIFIGLSMASGERVLPAEAAVGDVVKDSIADEAGFQPGDKITKLTFENGDSVSVDTFSDVVTQINYNPGETVFTIERDGKTLDLTATPEYNKQSKTYLVGIYGPKSKVEKISIGESFVYGTEDMVSSSTALFDSLGRIFQGKNLDQLSGPVGIFQVSAQAAESGLSVYLRLLAILSINIGVMNALPLPILDGGRVLITIIEKIRGRKLNEQLMNTLMWGGVLVLIALMVYATFNDVLKLF